MARFNLERRLEEARIPVHYLDLPEGIKGLSYRIADRMCISIDIKLDRVNTRCTLMHEYCHLDLFRGEPFSSHTTYTERQEGDIIEARVHAATAKRLVPTGKLTKMLKRGIPLHEIAELLDVTEEVVGDAIKYQLQAKGKIF